MCCVGMYDETQFEEAWRGKLSLSEEEYYYAARLRYGVNERSSCSRVGKVRDKAEWVYMDRREREGHRANIRGKLSFLENVPRSGRSDYNAEERVSSEYYKSGQ